MADDRPFTHPHFGSQVRVEQTGREVRLTFVANTEAQAADLAEKIVDQLAEGALNITLMGKPDRIIAD